MKPPPISPRSVDALAARLFEPDLHAKRVQSVANAVVGALTAATVSIHAIGRALAVARGLTPKHAIKQVDRLLSNEGVSPWALFAQWVPFCIGVRTEIVVALDWTNYDHDGHSTIALHLITSHGRATPLMWKTVEKGALQGWRNAYEDELLARFEEVLPGPVKVTVLADRGFGDQKLYALLAQLAFDFIIRFRGGIRVSISEGESKEAREWLSPTGRPRLLRPAFVTHDRTEVGAVVCVHAKGMAEPWYLATSLKTAKPAEIVKLYGRRFTIEESFRDIKDIRFGLGLSTVTIGDVGRRDRLLLVSAMAVALLTLLGAASEAVGLDRALKANTVKKRTHSLFFQGCYYYEALPNMREHDARSLMQAYDRLVQEHAVFSTIFGVL
jgi:hypothetical protein